MEVLAPARQRKRRGKDQTPTLVESRFPRARKSFGNRRRRRSGDGIDGCFEMS